MVNKKQYNYIQNEIAVYEEEAGVLKAIDPVGASAYRGRIKSLQSLLKQMEGGDKNDRQ